MKFLTCLLLALLAVQTAFAQGEYHVRVMGRSDLTPWVISQMEKKLGKTEDVFQNRTLKATVVTIGTYKDLATAQKKVTDVQALKRKEVRHIFIIPENVKPSNTYRIQLRAGKYDLSAVEKNKILDALSVLHLPFLVIMEKGEKYNRKFMVETKFPSHEMAVAIVPVLADLGIKGAFVVESNGK